MPCLPRDFLDVLQPITAYLQEITTRFSASLQQNPDNLSAAKALLSTLAAAAQQHLTADSPAATSRTVDWRRLLTSLQLLLLQLLQRSRTQAGR
jgi:hypothetical protein